MGVYDDIISGSFNTLGPSATSGWTAPSMSYAGQETGRDPNRLYPSSAGLPNPSPGSGMTPAQVAAAQMGVYGNPTTGASPAYASAYAPTGSASPMEDKLIASGVKPGIPMSQQGGINKVTGQLQQGQGQGGLLELLMGQSKNGQRGLLGLLGGPQQGGLLQMLMGGGRKPAAAPTPRGLTPSQQYAATNAASRDMARMNAGLNPLYYPTDGSGGSGAHSDYGGTGAASDNPYFSSGFGTAQGI